MIKKILLKNLSISLILPIIFSTSIFAASINVTTTTDQWVSLAKAGQDCVFGLSECALREAVAVANTLTGTDTINLPTGTFKLTIVGGHEDNNAKGDLDIKESVVINGIANGTFIDGNLADRIFHLQNGTLTLNSLTLQNGKTPNLDSAGGAIAIGAESFKNNFGWSLSNNTTNNLIINNSVVRNNKARAFGGAIANGFDNKNTSLTITDTKFLTNVVFLDTKKFNKAMGGAIFFFSKQLTITGSTFSQNVVEGDGGALFTQGPTSITKTLFNKNIASFLGGGINWLGSLGDQLTLTDSTLEENITVSMDGGALMVDKNGKAVIQGTTIAHNNSSGIFNKNLDLSLINSTISNNDHAGVKNILGKINFMYATIADNEFGIQTLNSIISQGVELTNTLLANNHGGNCKIDDNSQVTSKGHNFDSDDTCDLDQVTDIHNKDPLLAVLNKNGGFAKTRALLAGSPAIDKGNKNVGPLIDQRGIPRPVGANSDIGAFERFVIVIPNPDN